MAAKRGKRQSREVQLANYNEVKRLLSEGVVPKQIAKMVGVSEPTVYHYKKRDTAPGAVGQPKKSKMARVHRGRLAFNTGVPNHIALLRDGLVAAFLRGDLDEHARLTQQLKAALDASSFFDSFPVDPAKVKFESGTLNLLAPAE